MLSIRALKQDVRDMSEVEEDMVPEVVIRRQVFDSHARHYYGNKPGQVP